MAIMSMLNMIFIPPVLRDFSLELTHLDSSRSFSLYKAYRPHLCQLARPYLMISSGAITARKYKDSGSAGSRCAIHQTAAFLMFQYWAWPASSSAAT